MILKFLHPQLHLLEFRLSDVFLQQVHTERMNCLPRVLMSLIRYSLAPYLAFLPALKTLKKFLTSYEWLGNVRYPKCFPPLSSLLASVTPLMTTCLPEFNDFLMLYFLFCWSYTLVNWLDFFITSHTISNSLGSLFYSLMGLFSVHQVKYLIEFWEMNFYEKLFIWLIFCLVWSDGWLFLLMNCFFYE